MRYFAVDVFTDEPFKGNPAGVCVLEEWLSDDMLQSIAFENNLSETAFLVERGGCFDLRWFSPHMEVGLCGHATLGSAFVLLKELGRPEGRLRFQTKSGLLEVCAGEDGLLWMDFPARPAQPAMAWPGLLAALGLDTAEVFKAEDILVVVPDEAIVQGLSPDFLALRLVKGEAGMASDDFGVIVTAPGNGCDFVSRFFAPNIGIDEDPVTGRAHCTLVPYWSARLGKTSLTARQLSARGGRLWCEDRGGRVGIGGQARLYMSGEIHP